VVEETREFLVRLGIDPKRLHLKWISASEGAEFAEEMRGFVQLVKSLGKTLPPGKRTMP
jgi:coenzyme F420-reducing hydrogenase delta subunit